MNASKKDLCFTIIIATVILLGVITFWLGGKGNEMVSYVSFASAITSIILAVVAIIYSFIHNSNSQQNIGEMRTLVSEASRIMTEKADTMVDQSVSIGESLRDLVETSAKVSGPSAPLTDNTFSFDASNAPATVLLTFYYLAKCHEHHKPMDLNSLAFLICLPVRKQQTQISENLKRNVSLFGTGILSCMRCLLESESVVFIGPDLDKVEIKKLPTGFMENILSVINYRIQDSRREPSEKTRLENGMKKINALVEAA